MQWVTVQKQEEGRKFYRARRRSEKEVETSHGGRLAWYTRSLMAKWGVGLLQNIADLGGERTWGTGGQTNDRPRKFRVHDGEDTLRENQSNGAAELGSTKKARTALEIDAHATYGKAEVGGKRRDGKTMGAYGQTLLDNESPKHSSKECCRGEK